MRSRATLLGLLLLLTGCGRHPAQPADAQPRGTAPSATAPAATTRSISIFSTVCPQAPDKNAVQVALKTAMVQIYGTDEVTARVVVFTMRPTDCKNLVVSYEVSGTKTAAPLVYADDEKWHVTLFGKNYPVP